MQRPLALALPLAFWLGAPLGALPGAAWIAGAACLGLLAAARRLDGAGGPTMLLAALVGGALAGAVEHRWSADTPPHPPDMPLSATVEAVELRGPWVDVRLRPDAWPRHRIRLRSSRRPPGVAPGARVIATGRLRRLMPDRKSVV